MIVFDADLIWLYFKIEPRLAMVAITLAMANIRKIFKGVEVQVSNRLTKLLPKEISNKLDKQVPIIINKYITFNLKIPLNDTGRAVNLEDTIYKAT